MKGITTALIALIFAIMPFTANAGLSAADKLALNRIESVMGTKGFALGNILETTLYSPADGLFEIDGTIIGVKDNGTAMRVKGLQHSSEGSAQVQSYEGIFNNASYDTVGTLKTRYSVGANTEMDLAVQSPHALLLIGQDGLSSDGIVKVLTQNAFEVHAQYSAEELSPKRLIVDRVSTAAKGSANTSDVVVKTNSGTLHLQSGVTDGAVSLNSLTTAEKGALSPAAGWITYDETLGKFQGYDGAWGNIELGAEATFSATFSGDVAVGAKTVVVRKIGKQVTIEIPAGSTTDPGSAVISSGATDIPAAYRPAADLSFVAVVTDNNAKAFGTLTVSAAGQLTFGVAAAGGAFTDGANAGFDRIAVSYTLP